MSRRRARDEDEGEQGGREQDEEEQDDEEEEEEEDEDENDDGMDPREQVRLNEALLSACWEGSVAQVRKALRRGAHVNAENQDAQTGLVLACVRDDWDVALPLVKLLLSRGFSVRALDDFGENALHTACLCSSAAVVRLLLAAAPNALNTSCAQTRRSPGGDTPLLCACRRSDDESVRIAALLLDLGSDVNAAGPGQETALMCAAGSREPALVQLLIERGARLSPVDEKGASAVHHACSNAVHGRQVVPLLLAAGAIPKDLLADEAGSPFARAVCKSGAMAESLARFLPRSFRARQVRVSRADPVGSMVWCARYGASPSRDDFASKTYPDQLTRWAHLRNGRALKLDGSADDPFDALDGSECAALWRWALSELPPQHPVTGDTLFHVLCRSHALSAADKLVVLGDLRERHRNPLTPNYRNQLCTELTEDRELKAALASYMCWQPERRVMDWFGPFFQRRAWALLLVCHRLKRQHPKRLAGLNRDIRHLLVKHASRMEYLYVPAKLY
jgi:ankyrin repeat protein